MLNRGPPRFDCCHAWATQHHVNDRLATQTWNRGAADMLDREGRGAEAGDQEVSFGLEQRRPVRIIRNEINQVLGGQMPSLSQAGLTPPARRRQRLVRRTALLFSNELS